MKTNRLNSYHIITIIFAIAVLIPILLYYINFHNNGLSKNGVDWANFSTYISGIVSPIISIISVFVLLKVNESVKQSNFNIYNRYKRIIRKYKTIDFAIDLPKDLSFEKRIQDLHDLINNLESNIGTVFEDESSMKDEISKLCLKNGIRETLILDIFNQHECFESKCLAIPNLLTTIKAYLMLIEISHYEELIKLEKNASYEEKLEKLSKELEEYMRNNRLVD